MLALNSGRREDTGVSLDSRYRLFLSTQTGTRNLQHHQKFGSMVWRGSERFGLGLRFHDTLVDGSSFPLLLFPLLAAGLPGQWWWVSRLTHWDGLHKGEQVMSFFPPETF